MSFVVNPKITRFADLKGKKIAVSSFGSATDILARLTVEHFKLNPSKDVQFIAAGGGSGRLAQLESGLVDAAVVAPPSDASRRVARFQELGADSRYSAVPGQRRRPARAEVEESSRRSEARAARPAQGESVHSRRSRRAPSIFCSSGDARPAVAEQGYLSSSAQFHP